jgi:hypothetical protein
MYIQCHDIVEILLELALNTNQSIDVHTVNSKLLHDWGIIEILTVMIIWLQHEILSTGSKLNLPCDKHWQLFLLSFLFFLVAA